MRTRDASRWPQIALDEAGNTGENLLDRAQPVHVLVAVHLDQARAASAIGAALARTQMKELKFARLRGSGRGRRNILALIDELALTDDDAAAFATDKAWMLAAKLVDALVEPRMLASGQQVRWYLSGEARAMAEVLYERGPRVLGDCYAELIEAFVPLARCYEPGRAATFLEALARARVVARDANVHAILASMIDTPGETAAAFETSGDGLDPHLPALWWQAGYWSRRFDRFEIVHDESVTASQWTARLAEAAAYTATRAEGRTLAIGGLRIDLPAGIRDITFKRSDDDPRIQVADILAGATAHVFGAVAQIHPEDGFSRELERRGVGRLVRATVSRPLDDLRLRRLGRSAADPSDRKQ
jgi:hypothetical protein